MRKTLTNKTDMIFINYPKIITVKGQRYDLFLFISKIRASQVASSGNASVVCYEP